jgi:uncharacterized membrane protein
MRTLSRYDLWLCALMLWGATFCAALSVITLLRLPLGLAAVLFVPGYLLQSVFFPQLYEVSLIARLGYSFAFSLALAILIGLILNLTVGLQPIYLIMAITAAGMLLIWVAWWRRNSAEQGFAPPLQNLAAPARNRSLLMTVLLLCVGEFVLLVLFLLVVNPTNDNLTEFYLLEPTSRQAENLPTTLKTNERVNVVLGIVNREGQTHEYRVEILINGQKSGGAGGWRINSNGKLEVNLSFIPKTGGADVPVLFRLYRAGDTAPHRSLRLVIPNISS